MQSVSIRCAMLADSSAVAELNRVAMGTRNRRFGCSFNLR